MKRRNTQQKSAILEVIQGVGKHMSAEEVKVRLDEKNLGIGLATVYRNLNLLCEEGIIQKVTTNDFSFFDGNSLPHDHLHCVSCGKVVDIESSYNRALDHTISKQTGAKIIRHSSTFEGICPECLKKEENGNGIKRN